MGWVIPFLHSRGLQAERRPWQPNLILDYPDEVIIRIADSLGYACPQVEVENILEDLAKAGKILKGTATGRSTYKWLGAVAVRKPQKLAS